MDSIELCLFFSATRNTNPTRAHHRRVTVSPTDCQWRREWLSLSFTLSLPSRRSSGRPFKRCIFLRGRSCGGEWSHQCRSARTANSRALQSFVCSIFPPHKPIPGLLHPQPLRLPRHKLVGSVGSDRCWFVYVYQIHPPTIDTLITGVSPTTTTTAFDPRTLPSVKKTDLIRGPARADEPMGSLALWRKVGLA